MLLRLLTARLGSAEDAEDAFQDMWLRLDNALTGPIAQPSAYLFRMANNIASDRRRSASRALARDRHWLDLQVAPEEIPGIEDALIAREALARVEAVLNSLPKPAARAFRRFRLDGVPQKDIAAEMGLSLSSVEKLLQRAYRRVYDRRNVAGGEQKQAGSMQARRPRSEEDLDQ